MSKERGRRSPWRRAVRTVVMWAISATLAAMTAVFAVLRLLHLSLFEDFLRRRLLRPAEHPERVEEVAPGILRTHLDPGLDLPALGYGFARRYVTLPVPLGPTGTPTNLRIHYVDAGADAGAATHTVLLLHGEPSWSFLYRKVVAGLVAGNAEGGDVRLRCIAPDFVGFGLSDKPASLAAYTHDMHMATLRLLVEKLDLRNIILVVQDWGGLTGLGALPTFDARVSSLVIMNTGLPTGFSWLRILSSGATFVLWRTAVKFLGVDLPVRRVFRMACKGAPPAVLDAYAAPFPDHRTRAGVAVWPLLVPLRPSFPVAASMRQARQHLQSAWASRPVLIMFSDRDPITRGGEKDFARLLPHARTTTVAGGGHFLQEDCGEVLAENILKWCRSSFQAFDLVDVPADDTDSN